VCLFVSALLFFIAGCSSGVKAPQVDTGKAIEDLEEMIMLDEEAENIIALEEELLPDELEEELE